MCGIRTIQRNCPEMERRAIFPVRFWDCASSATYDSNTSVEIWKVKNAEIFDYLGIFVIFQNFSASNCV